MVAMPHLASALRFASYHPIIKLHDRRPPLVRISWPQRDLLAAVLHGVFPAPSSRALVAPRLSLAP